MELAGEHRQRVSRAGLGGCLVGNEVPEDLSVLPDITADTLGGIGHPAHRFAPIKRGTDRELQRSDNRKTEIFEARQDKSGP